MLHNFLVFCVHYDDWSSFLPKKISRKINMSVCSLVSRIWHNLIVPSVSYWYLKKINTGNLQKMQEFRDYLCLTKLIAFEWVNKYAQRITLCKGHSARTSKASERVCCHHRSGIFFAPKGSHYWFVRRKIHPWMFLPSVRQRTSHLYSLSNFQTRSSETLDLEKSTTEKHHRIGEFDLIAAVFVAVIWEPKIWISPKLILSNLGLTLLLLLI